MKYPACYAFWIETEIGPGEWDSSLPVRSGCESIDVANERLLELRTLGLPWSGRAFRLLTPAGIVLETLEAPQPQAGGPGA